MNTNEAITRLVEADRAYYQTGSPVMTDAEYDALRAWVKKEEPDHPYFETIGHEPSSAWEKASHDIPMGSLDNVFTEEDFRKWTKRFPEGTKFISEPKWDGLSLDMIFDNSELIQGITRGDGFQGEDITANVARMRGTKAKKEASFTGSVRGEVMLSKENFDKINSILSEKNRYKNARNAAAGISRRLDGKFCSYLTVMSYDVTLSADTDEDKKIEYLSDELGLCASIYRSGDADEIVGIYERVKENRSDFPYGIDGVVIKACEYTIQEQMGATNNRPRSQIAWKFDPPGAITKLLGVTWGLGRTGVVTPLGHVEPVKIEGSTIKNVTLHNVAEIERLGIGIGDTVMIVKAGDIIPKIVSVIEHVGNPIEIPTACPDCSAPLDNDGIRLMCRNESCSSRVFFRIMNWVKVVSIDGLGESLVDKLFNSGEEEGSKTINGIADLYGLEASDIASLEGWGKRSAARIIDNIQTSRKIKPAVFLAAVGVPGISHKTAEDLFKRFETVNDVLSASAEDIAEMKGYSTTSAESITKNLGIYHDEIVELMEIVELINEEDLEGVLSGKSFCFTGSMSKSRKYYQELVKRHGGTNKSSVTKDLSYLVCNEDKGSLKLVNATKQGVSVISEKEFLDMAGEQIEMPDKKKIKNVPLF